MKRTYMISFILPLLVLFVVNCGGGDSNSKPVVEAGLVLDGVFEGEVFSFAGSYSDIDTTDTHELAWDFGDGSPAVLDTLTPSHIFTDSGDLTVTFAVRDSSGGVGTDTVQVTVANVPPVALAGTDLSGYEGSNVTFNGNFTDAGSADTITLYEWDFEYDGVTFDPDDTGQSIQHSWPDEGVHDVALRVWDDDGDPSMLDTLVVTIENVDPVVEAEVDDSSPDEGQMLSFAGSFTDPGSINDSPYTIEWDFDDGNSVSGTTSAILTQSHAFENDGTYEVTLTVTDDVGGVGFATVTVGVGNVEPTVDAWGDQSGYEGQSFSFAGSFSDPGADDHTVEWDFGDGTTVSGPLPAVLNQSHIYTDNGDFTVLLTVNDGNGGEGTDSFVVAVTNVPPLAIAGTDLSGYEGTNITFYGNFTDAGDADTIDLYEWDFEYDGVTFDPDDTGQSVQNSWPDEGVHLAALRVWDDDGDPSLIDTLVVTVNNADPVVDACEPQTIDEGDQFAGSGSFTDLGVDDDPWTATVNYGDGGGDQALLLTDQSFALAHTYADDGAYTVTVTVSDVDGGSSADTLTVTVNNADPAVSVSSGDLTIDEGDQFAGSGSFIDAGVNDSWSATVNYGDGSGDQTLLLTDQSFALAHTYPDDGEFTVTVTVSDADGGSGVNSTLTVTVNNVSPVVSAGDDQTIDEGDQFAGSGSFIDAGVNDSWSATVNYGDGSGDQTLLLTDQSFALAHTYTDESEYTVTVTVSDTDGGSHADTLIVTVNAVPPETPTNLAETLITTSSVAMAWSDNATYEDGYSVLRSGNMGGPFNTLADLGPDSESYTDSGLEPGTNYYYRVAAWNTAGPSYSSVLGITTELITLGPVAAYYGTNGVNWNDYIDNDGMASGGVPAMFLASDTAAAPTGTGGYSSVLHGGEMRAVAVTGISDCTGITAYDTLGAFEWTCLPGDPVTVVSTGLADGAYLSDLIDFGTSPYWRENSVTVNVNNDEKGYGITPASYWWSNPVYELPGSGTLSTEGAVYAVAYTTTSIVPGDIVIGADKVALVTQPGAIALQGTIEGDNVVQAVDRSFLWIEADMMGASVGSGSATILDLTGVDFSVLRRVSASDSGTGSGVHLDDSASNLLVDVSAWDNNGEHDGGIGLGSGIHLESSVNNLLRNVSAWSNNTDGIYLNANSNLNRIISARLADNVRHALQFWHSYENVASEVTAYNNHALGLGYGGGVVFASGSADNVVANLTSFNNRISGIHYYGAGNNVMINATAANNGRRGASYWNASNNTLANFAGVNNGPRNITEDNDGQGLYIYAGGNDNLFCNVGAGKNPDGVRVYTGITGNTFTGKLRLGSNRNNEFVLEAGATVIYSNADSTYSAYWETSFAAKVYTDSVNTSHTDGEADYVDIDDWTGFENGFRGWGRGGTTDIIHPNNRGFASTTLHIWDWSLVDDDDWTEGANAVLDFLGIPSVSDTLTHTWSDASTTQFLRNAVEIMDDDVGDDDGLCEAAEHCIFTPNIGSYQGHGSLEELTTVGDITLYNYEENGVDRQSPP